MCSRTDQLRPGSVDGKSVTVDVFSSTSDVVVMVSGISVEAGDSKRMVGLVCTEAVDCSGNLPHCSRSSRFQKDGCDADCCPCCCQEGREAGCYGGKCDAGAMVLRPTLSAPLMCSKNVISRLSLHIPFPCTLCMLCTFLNIQIWIPKPPSADQGCARVPSSPKS